MPCPYYLQPRTNLFSNHIYDSTSIPRTLHEVPHKLTTNLFLTIMNWHWYCPLSILILYITITRVYNQRASNLFRRPRPLYPFCSRPCTQTHLAYCKELLTLWWPRSYLSLPNILVCPKSTTHLVCAFLFDTLLFIIISLSFIYPVFRSSIFLNTFHPLFPAEESTKDETPRTGISALHTWNFLLSFLRISYKLFCITHEYMAVPVAFHFTQHVMWQFLRV